MSDKKDNFTVYVALSTAAMAVMAAVTTLYVGKFSSRTVLLQAQESDQWAYYQAKSIKSHAYELQKQLVELEFLAQKSRYPKDLADKFEKTVAGYESNIKRYEDERKEIKAKADGFGRDKHVSQERASIFGYGLIFFQIAIMLSSVSALTKKRELWLLGIAASLIGLFFFIDGHYLFY